MNDQIVETDSEGIAEDLLRAVRNVSQNPGVYLMQDLQGTILYVGKARNLKKRLQSYFQKNRPHDPKTTLLLSKVVSFRTILTNTEKEALILESNLIKRHRPRYNVVLKDDKRYPSLRLDTNKPYPSLTVVRKITNDGALYFGPYASAGAVRQTLKFINKTFKLCKCRCDRFRKRERPCLNFQMGLCMGPCFMEVAPERYKEAVKEVIAFLRGRTPELIRRIKKQMQAAAERQDFEQAAMLRDKMFALEKTLERQVSVSADRRDRDALGVVVADDLTAFALLRVRGGFLMGGRQFIFENAVGNEHDQLGAFLKQYYASDQVVPGEVVLSHTPIDDDLIEMMLADRRGAKVALTVPQRGDKQKLVHMAVENARQALNEGRIHREAQMALLAGLEKRLHLRRLPRRIECFDNSHLGGTEPVSGMVVFEHGKPQPNAYRRYKITAESESDDYAYMAEVIKRRYRKIDDDNPCPDLLLVDGGKGQLNVVLAILNELDLSQKFDVAAIAKKDERLGEKNDKIYLAGRTNPVQFGKDLDLLLFLQRVRDETHRWVITFQRKRRGSRALHSELDNIKGVGPKRKSMLLNHFGSLEKLRSASLETLSALPGITEEMAHLIKNSLSFDDSVE